MWHPPRATQPAETFHLSVRNAAEEIIEAAVLKSFGKHTRSASSMGANWHKRTAQPVMGLLQMLMLASSSALSLDIELDPTSKWIHCIDDGRLNIRWSLHSNGKLHSGLQLPELAEKCKPSKPTGCKWLVACETSTDCSKFFPGELSGRRKCLVVINSSSSESRHASIQLDLESAGNWAAIIFGVVLTTLALVAVVAAGCYSDLRKLATADKKRRRSAADNSRRTTKTAAG